MLVETVVKPVFTLATLDSAFNVKFFFIFMLYIKMSEKFTQKKADKSTRAQPALPNARHDRDIADRGGLETINKVM